MSILIAAGCSRPPVADSTTKSDGKQESQPPQSDAAPGVAAKDDSKWIREGPTKSAPPAAGDRRSLEDQEFERLLALADAALAQSHLAEAKDLYGQCQKIRKDARVEQKLAAIDAVSDARQAIEQAKNFQDDPVRLLQLAVRLETALAAFAKNDSSTKQSFAGIVRELQTGTQWMFGQLADTCERVSGQCKDAATVAYQKNELAAAQKHAARLAEVLRPILRNAENLLADMPVAPTAPSGALRELAKDAERVALENRKLELVKPAYLQLRKLRGQPRFTMDDRERLTATRDTLDKVVGMLDGARKQIGDAGRPWIDGELKQAQTERNDIQVLIGFFGLENQALPMRIDSGAFATAPAEWPRDFDLQLAFAAMTASGKIKNSFLERGDKDQPFRLPNNKTYMLSSRAVEVQLVSKSSIGEDVVLRFCSEQHPLGYLPNLTVARIAKFKPAYQPEYEFTTNITGSLGVDLTKPLPERPIKLRLQCTKNKEGTRSMLRISLDEKPLYARPTKENPKGAPYEIAVNDDFCQVKLALLNAPGLTPAMHQLRIESARAVETKDGQ